VYAKGDVVLVPFPFTDQSAAVTRPALVVSAASYNEASGDVIVAMITSRRHGLPTDVELHQWNEAGLLHPSWVRAKLATVSDSLVRYSPGQVARDDLAAVDSAMKLALGF